MWRLPTIGAFISRHDLELGGIVKLTGNIQLFRGTAKTPLEKWASKCQMSFDMNKCKSSEHWCQKSLYQLLGSELAVIDEKRDLGEMVNN